MALAVGATFLAVLVIVLALLWPGDRNNDDPEGRDR